MRTTSGSNLEFDGYCAELKIAFEHQGHQHFRKSYYMSDVDFLKQQQRDRIKKTLAEQNGILLIEVSRLGHYHRFEDLPQIVRESLLQAGREVPDKLNSPIPKNLLIHSSDDLFYHTRLKKIASGNGGALLESKFLGHHSSHRFRCKKKHLFTKTSASVVSGEWCPRCTASGRSENQPRAKLNKDKVIWIHEQSAGGMKNTEIARKLDVSITSIGYVINGKTWKHVSRKAIKKSRKAG